MNFAKNSITSTFSKDHIGDSTSRFTRPLVLKVIGAFAVMVVMLLILTSVALFNISQGKESSRMALKLQTEANLTQRLRESLVSERFSVLNTLYTGIIDPNLEVYRNNLARASRELLELGVETYSLELVHEKLRKQYTEVIETNIVGNPAQARSLWQTVDVEAEQLLKLVDARLDRANKQAIEATLQADRVQNQASGFTIGVSVVAFVVLILVIAFVVITVLAPLRVLNQNLTDLLWTQTEHLTDRINIMQAEISLNNETLTTVRHDLKSPLSSIRGLAELCTILQPNLTNDVQENLEKIIEISDGSVDTIGAVLARREQQLELQPVPLNRLVDKVLQLVDLRYYNVQRKVEAEEWVLDPTLMEHALLNLISNARKFSSQGIGVGVRSIRKAGTVDTEELELWVWNDGAVINAEDRNEIFKYGKQTAEGKKAGGHGLGLYIVKAIAERHHGRVTVESHEKIGTTFRVFIPRLEPTTPALDLVPLRPQDEMQDYATLLKV